MTDAAPLSVVLAGGGSAGHVNPLLATADALRRRDPETVLTVLGTAEGLEARLVPARGYPFHVLPKAPFPRRPNGAALKFPAAMSGAVKAAATAMREAKADVVVGFGGYVATPAYLAARRLGLPIVIHEQNARPGLANKLGARFTPHIATTFASTPLPGARHMGMPLRAEISNLDRDGLRRSAREHFELDPDVQTLLVFGGSLGAARLNDAFSEAAVAITDAGVQVLHITGEGKEIALPAQESLKNRYRAITYSDRMDLAYASADLAVCRSGAGTLCEIAAIGLPAALVPLPIGNGEQRLNAQDLVAAGGATLTDDSEVDVDWVKNVVIPLLADSSRVEQMSAAAAAIGHRDGDDALVAMIYEAAKR